VLALLNPSYIQCAERVALFFVSFIRCILSEGPCQSSDGLLARLDTSCRELNPAQVITPCGLRSDLVHPFIRDSTSVPQPSIQRLIIKALLGPALAQRGRKDIQDLMPGPSRSVLVNVESIRHRYSRIWREPASSSPRCSGQKLERWRGGVDDIPATKPDLTRVVVDSDLVPSQQR
jgi:hypothetical protein